MSYHLDESCTYHAGDETCFRADCKIVCMRNFRDQLDTDIPLVSQNRKPAQPPAGLWHTLFHRRTAKVAD